MKELETVDSYLKNRDINGLKKYSRHIPFNNEAYTKAELAIVNDYIKKQNINGLKEHIRHIPFNNEAYTKAELAIVNDYIKKQNINGLKEHTRHIPFNNEAYAKAELAISNFAGMRFFSRTNNMPVTAKHLTDDAMAKSAFGQSNNSARFLK